MVQVQFDKREINCKVVYYGPEGAGKTANLHAIQAKAPRGSLSALCCGPGSDLALEHLQVDLGRVDEMRTKLHVYAIPARAPEETRRRILRGCDALVFVANGRPEQLAANRESLDLLTADLAAVELSLAGIPLVVQWNHWGATARGKSEALSEALGLGPGCPSFAACTGTGEGVLSTFKAASLMVLDRLAKEYGFGGRAETRRVRRPAAAPAAAPVRSARALGTASTRLRALRVDPSPAGEAPRTEPGAPHVAAKAFEVKGVSKPRRGIAGMLVPKRLRGLSSVLSLLF